MRSGNFKENYRQLLALTDSTPVIVWSVLLVAGLAVAPLVVGKYFATLLLVMMITAVGVLGLNLLTGNTGLISLGHAGFLAVGAYATAIVAGRLGWPMPASLLAGGTCAALAGLVVGIPSLRLKGLYLAITTMAFAVIINHLILNGGSLTGGSEGLSVPQPALFGVPLAAERGYFLFVLGTLVLAVFAMLNLLRSRVGRALMAIRDHDIAARAMGIDLVRWKLLAFMVSAFYTGVAGGLLAYYTRYLNVDSFSLLVSIEALSMLIVGGLGSVAGALMGTAFIFVLNEGLGLLFSLLGSGTLSTAAYEVKGIVYGLAIVLFLRFEPDGLVGRWRDLKHYWTHWPFRF
ncbi:MAG: branched-chain amino acid ABC transporter permease [Comamonadaceae bacterium SCN 68-20]|nr:MAG: branched-chain amino acid ABC transporter permease [Comamonadaceae bacterium SCN 68-20]